MEHKSARFEGWSDILKNKIAPTQKKYLSFSIIYTLLLVYTYIPEIKKHVRAYTLK